MKTPTQKVSIRCKDSNKPILIFLVSMLILTMRSFLYLDINYLKLLIRSANIGSVFFIIAYLDFTQ